VEKFSVLVEAKVFLCQTIFCGLSGDQQYKQQQQKTSISKFKFYGIQFVVLHLSKIEPEQHEP
jgi:hypothetical protein